MGGLSLTKNAVFSQKRSPRKISVKMCVFGTALLRVKPCFETASTVLGGVGAVALTKNAVVSQVLLRLDPRQAGWAQWL